MAMTTGKKRALNQGWMNLVHSTAIGQVGGVGGGGFPDLPEEVQHSPNSTAKQA